MLSEGMAKAENAVRPNETVRVRAIQDEVILNPSQGRVKKGTVQEMDRVNAEIYQTRGYLEILPD